MEVEQRPSGERAQAFLLLFLLFSIFVATPGYLFWERSCFDGKGKEAEATSPLTLNQQQGLLEQLKDEANRASPSRSHFFIYVPPQVGKQAIDNFLDVESKGPWLTDRWWRRADRRRILIFIAREK